MQIHATNRVTSAQTTLFMAENAKDVWYTAKLAHIKKFVAQNENALEKTEQAVMVTSVKDQQQRSNSVSGPRQSNQTKVQLA